MDRTIFGAKKPLSIAAQLQRPSIASTASASDLAGRATVSSLPQATWNNRRFVRDDLVSKKGSRGRTSWIKTEGTFVREVLAGDRLGDPFWVCRRCDERGDPNGVFKAIATTSATHHLNVKHKVYEDTAAAAGTTEPEDEAPSPKRLRPTIITKSEVASIQELAVSFIVKTDSPFTTFENHHLRALLTQFNEDLTRQTSWSRTHMVADLHRLYLQKKDSIKRRILSALTKAHLSFDLWTSPNRLAMVAIYSHFLDKDGRQAQYLLALRRQLGHHSGENIAHTIYSVLTEWGIQDRIGAVVSDNASNNDTCLRHLFQRLSPEYSESDVTHRRLRCYGHILNLVGKAILHGVDQDAFEQESQGLVDSGRLEEDLALWRKKGPVGKLRNIVRYIRSSPQRCERFLRISGEAEEVEAQTFTIFEESSRELVLTLNNETRWNSTYLMIQRALQKREQLSHYLFDSTTTVEASQRLAPEDSLTPEDWRVLIELMTVLEPLYHQTMRTQGRARGDGHGRLWEVMAGIEYLLDRLEDFHRLFGDTEVGETASQAGASSALRRLRTPPPQPTRLPEHIRPDYLPQQRQQNLAQRLEESGILTNHYFRVSVVNGWEVLNKYYTMLGKSPFYPAAVILHPGYGLPWLEKRWRGQGAWIYEAKEGLRTYWQKWYSNAATQGPPTSPPSQGPFVVLAASVNKAEDSDFRQWLNDREIQATITDASELDQYFRSLIPRAVDDPVQWWLDQRHTYPTLSRLALDILAIPAMATECERTFSLAKLSLTSQRLSMSSKTLEELQCTKNWLEDRPSFVRSRH